MEIEDEEEGEGGGSGEEGEDAAAADGFEGGLEIGEAGLIVQENVRESHSDYDTRRGGDKFTGRRGERLPRRISELLRGSGGCGRG